jgi:pimeloyl-ACP methyl ester carboxylesterase
VGAPQLLFLHGMLDTSASWQFVVDELQRDWDVIAPDLRGHGGSWWPRQSQNLADMTADIAALIEQVSPTSAITVVGHSLGGALAWTYAGTFPQRIAKLVIVDAVWAQPGPDGTVPERYERWLKTALLGPQLRRYDSKATVAVRLRKANPRLTTERAAFLAESISRALPDGGWTLAFDPWLSRELPIQQSLDDVAQFWRRVHAPVLWIGGRESWVAAWLRDHFVQMEKSLSAFAHVALQYVDGAGHNVHHDRPEYLAKLIEEFLADPVRRGA